MPLESGHVFTEATDARLIDLIRRARDRLVVVCPALTTAVAQALAARLPDEGSLRITVIVDTDPEVYRLGYGTVEALDILHDAAVKNMFDLRVQHGVRIGLVVCDKTTMIFAPVPLLIEAGSTAADKPNAIVLGMATTEQPANAARTGQSTVAPIWEIGSQALTPVKLSEVREDLRVNPPQPFDITRALRVFTSMVQYVEFKVENYRFSSRQVRLPPELLGFADQTLKQRIRGHLRMFDKTPGPFKIEVPCQAGKETVLIDEKRMATERKRIEDKFTFSVPGFGRVMLLADRKAFDAEVTEFQAFLNLYHNEVKVSVENAKAELQQRVVNEFLPRWEERPPERFARYSIAATKENLKAELSGVVERIVDQSFSVEPPQIRVIYKNIAPESVGDPKFLNTLRDRMERHGVPAALIASLFVVSQAAPTIAGQPRRT